MTARTRNIVPIFILILVVKGIPGESVAIGNQISAQGVEEYVDYEDYEGEDYSGDDYEYVEPNFCDFYDDAYSTIVENCTNQIFLDDTKPLKEIYGPDAKTCCQNHAYLYVEKCEDTEMRKRNMDTEVCGIADNIHAPEERIVTILKPDHCNMKRFENFTVTDDGKLHLPSFPDAEIIDYCLFYECHGDNPRFWSVKAEVAFCYGKTSYIDYDKNRIHKSLQRCCPKTRKLALKKNHETITCPFAEHENIDESHASLRKCDGDTEEWFELDTKHFRQSNNHSMISFHLDDLKVKKTMPKEDIKYCFGVDDNPFPNGPHHFGPFKPALMYCHNRCFGKRPCLRFSDI